MENLPAGAFEVLKLKIQETTYKTTYKGIPLNIRNRPAQGNGNIDITWMFRQYRRQERRSAAMEEGLIPKSGSGLAGMSSDHRGQSYGGLFSSVG